MVSQVNLVNVAKLIFLPVVYLALREYQLIQGFVLGLLTLSLFKEVHEYGLKALIFKPA